MSLQNAVPPLERSWRDADEIVVSQVPEQRV
jgi:hypothetical protein